MRHPVSDTVLRGAAARAGGELVWLNLNSCPEVSAAALLEVVTANAVSLRELHLSPFSSRHYITAAILAALVRAAPQLQLLKTGMRGSLGELTTVLRKEPPYQAVQLSRVHATANAAEAANSAAILAFAAALTGHAPHTVKVAFHIVPLFSPAVLDTVVAALLSSPISHVSFSACGLTPASVPALARLLRDGRSLKDVRIGNNGVRLLDGPAAALLAPAFASNHRLTTLQLSACDLWGCDAAAVAILRALTAHPSLRSALLDTNPAPGLSFAPTALGALVFANAPALQKLDVQNSRLGDIGVVSMIDALPHNTNLRELYCSHTGMTTVFAQTRVVPAVLLNTSLRKLDASKNWMDGATPLQLQNLEQMVSTRGAV